MKIVTVLGARPQFIKSGVVSREFSKYSQINEIVVNTGQHYDANMSDIFFKDMGIKKPDYNLGIGGGSHGEMTGKMIEQIESILTCEKPDFVLLYGDTNSTLAGAIAAVKLHIKIAHVEAGLRSFNMKMPEEINRILTDKVSTLLFCPTKIAMNNLKNEICRSDFSKCILTGDVMQDSAFYYKKIAKKPDILINSPFDLCTIHRAENTDNKERLSNIVDALNSIGNKNKIILPLHPRTKQKINLFGIKFSKHIEVVEPLGYLQMLWLLNNCSLVLTDSGGLQKEAFFFEKPCITLRDETEWVELVEAGVNKIVGTQSKNILLAYKEFKSNNKNIYNQNLYGGGMASSIIVNEIIQYA